MKRLEACPEAGDIPQPVDGGAGEGSPVASPLEGELEQNVDAFQGVSQLAAPAVLAGEAVTVSDTDDGEDCAERHQGRPGDGEVEPRLASSLGEQGDRGRAGGGCERRMLEGVQGHHANLALALSA